MATIDQVGRNGVVTNVEVGREAITRHGTFQEQPAAAPAGGGLFMAPQQQLNGLQVGGPFFANPIG